MNGKLRVACVAGFGLVVGFGGEGAAQGPGPLPPSPLAPGVDLNRISKRMADAVHDLADDLAAGPGRNPAGQYLEPDARELEAALGAWAATVQATANPYQLRRSYSGIDVAWHRLRGQISGSGLAEPVVAEEIRRVEAVDAQIHQALGLKVYPPDAGGGFIDNPAPGIAPLPANTNPDEARRLTYAVAQRAEALAGIIRAEVAAHPALGARIAEVDQLAQAIDNYYNVLNNPATAGQPDLARTNYPPIVRQANALGVTLDATGMTPPLRATWDSFAAAHNLLRSQLNLNYPTPDGLPAVEIQVSQPGYVVLPNPVEAVAGWAVELDRQVDDLLVHFVPTVGVVPEGRFMLADMERLKRAVVIFHQESARGTGPGRLAFIFQDVDTHWQRLARRVDRIGRGRTGPNIQRIAQIGQTCQQVHQALGMPGYPPTLGPN